MTRISLTVLALALMAGCASQPARAPQPKVNLSGFPPEFGQGYADGCASVNAARKRDEARFKSDANYAMGWRDGYSICKPR
ncbi:MAG: hypothetical protein HYU73_17635 [Betaproteobacteria bacterium]|nr:hypothetical protein [Betaproteobacteria bacterium]